MGLDQATLNRILAPKPKAKTEIPPTASTRITGKRYSPPPQRGPLRWHDKPRKCLSPGCGSPTVLTVDYKAVCSAHALVELNNMVNELTDRIASDRV